MQKTAIFRTCNFTITLCCPTEDGERTADAKIVLAGDERLLLLSRASSFTDDQDNRDGPKADKITYINVTW